MNIKKKLTGALAIATATLMISLPGFAGTNTTPKEEKKIEVKEENSDQWFFDEEFKNKLGQDDYMRDLTKGYVKFCKIFEEEFGKEFEIELKKRKVYDDYLRIKIQNENSPKNTRSSFWKEDEKVREKIQEAAREAALDALETAGEDLDTLDWLVDRLEGIFKLEYIKSKFKKKSKLKTPITGIKEKKKSKEERLEDRIDDLDDDIKDLRRTGNIREAERLEKEKEKLKDILYKDRKFKIAFGMNMNYDDFNIKPYIKMKSRYMNGRIYYETNDNKVCLELSRDFNFIKDLHVSLNTMYKEDTKFIDNKREDFELSTTVYISKKFPKHINISLSHSHPWNYEHDSTGVTLSKTFDNGLSMSINGNYTWQKKDYTTMFNFIYDF